MLDLFCGRFGWALEFLARGWDVTAIDIVRPEYVPEGIEFVQCDVLQLRNWGRRIGVPAQIFGALWSTRPDFVCASSSCEEFSKWGLRCFFPEPPFPEMGVKLFTHTQQLCESAEVPYVMENVRAAQRFVGKAVNHCGPFYLWGNAVPPLMPQGIIKGMTRRALGHYDYKGEPGWNTKNERANRRQSGDAAAGLAATIPPELANCVADYAERLLEQTNSKQGISGQLDPEAPISGDAS
jgi:hypothetical protein